MDLSTEGVRVRVFVTVPCRLRDLLFMLLFCRFKIEFLALVYELRLSLRVSDVLLVAAAGAACAAGVGLAVASDGSGCWGFVGEAGGDRAGGLPTPLAPDTSLALGGGGGSLGMTTDFL